MRYLILLPLLLALGACSGGMNKLLERSSTVVLDLNKLGLSAGVDVTGAFSVEAGRKSLRLAAVPNSIVTGDGDGEQVVLRANRGEDLDTVSVLFYDSAEVEAGATASLSMGSGLAIGAPGTTVAMGQCLIAAGGDPLIAQYCRTPAATP